MSSGCSIPINALRLKSQQRRQPTNVKTMLRSLCLSLERSFSTPAQSHAMDLAQEKGAMSWLTSLLLKELNLTLHKSAFQDAFALRYGRLPKDIPTHCSCGSNFSTEHALSVQRVVLQ